ncbi:MAG: hypothetical protein WBA74_02530, partial [Cyclobacteriaceae bacterium]
YGITRINADLSGSWTLNLRCEGQTVDAINFELDFPTSSENEFVVYGSGDDYDGSKFNCTINMSYNSASNTLSGISYITKDSAPDFYRYDSFTIKLDRDETPYFPWTLGDNQNSGCVLEGQLLNNAASASRPSKSKTISIREDIKISSD